MNAILKTTAAATALVLTGAAAQAATLTLSGTGTAVAFDSGFSNYDGTCEGDNTTCYDPNGTAAGLTEDVEYYTASNPTPGLSLSESAQIVVTYLGKEAGATNEAYSFTLGDTLSTATSAVGDSYAFSAAAGVLPFVFSTSLGGIASNSGTIDSGLSIAFSLFNNGKSAYAFFDDSGAGVDVDLDDMVVRIDVVPVPAAAIPLITGVAALGFVGRRRRKAAKA